jgi:hypothetical protein
LKAEKSINKKIRQLNVTVLIGYECEAHNNPPDFFLDVINGDSTAVKSLGKILMLIMMI